LSTVDTLRQAAIGAAQTRGEFKAALKGGGLDGLVGVPVFTSVPVSNNDSAALQAMLDASLLRAKALKVSINAARKSLESGAAATSVDRVNLVQSYVTHQSNFHQEIRNVARLRSQIATL
jgi:hypothetical protein